MNLVYKMHSLYVRNCVRRTIGRYLTSSLARPKETIDPLQEAALKENCFLVNINDEVIGTASKKVCHAVREDGTIPLHRAFSVFLFDKKGDLLLQRRADTKITYPNHYTNTCCSHPIFDIPGEEEEQNASGVIRAARRRLNYELGIDYSQIPHDLFYYMTRIHYMDRGNGIWGEHEIDYILFLQTEVDLKPNANEVSEVVFVSRKNFNSFLSKLESPLTPWFRMILKYKLPEWWDNLSALDQFKDHNSIFKIEK